MILNYDNTLYKDYEITVYLVLNYNEFLKRVLFAQNTRSKS